MSEPGEREQPDKRRRKAEAEGLAVLTELALDLRWSRDRAGDDIWRRLDAELWALTSNPWVVLQTVSRERIVRLLSDPVFRRDLEDLAKARRDTLTSSGWFQRKYPASALSRVAYFSLEFMLSEALPIYSGGLGNVAGDQLKSASDLGVPVVGVGLLYQQGYFRQMIDARGEQQALFPYNDPGQLPVKPLRRPDGEWLRLPLELPGRPLWLRSWEVQVGQAKLFLLDSNDPANTPAHRGITAELYGGGPELRIQQEMVLGLGGWRLLGALGLRPEVCHLNEGHAAFAVLERALDFMRETGQSFEVALAATRAGNLFTSHTAVPAGFDCFSPELVGQYLGRYAERDLQIGLPALLALGRRNAGPEDEEFNMAYLAIRGSGAVNGVSRLHGEVSRRLFAPLFPRWPEAEIPVGHVTNGVHVPSWDSAEADEAWTEACGKDRWMGPADELEEKIRNLSDARLWRLRTDAGRALVDYARGRLAGQLAAAGASSEEVAAAERVFNPQALILGFARRFAEYKRPNLLLRDPDRLLRILSNPKRPAQLIIAGKAHPADRTGRALIREWIEFIRRPEARSRIVFLSDYDMLLTERLVQGVDVWINTPRRPWEACGTSGMKTLVNGGLNLSELDGWWAEAYAPETGWALGDGREHGQDASRDASEAEALYDLLEHEVIPEFYTRDERGIPVAWIRRMRESMARLTPRFSANRSVCEYAERYYLPAAEAVRRRTAEQGAVGREIVAWRRALDRGWNRLGLGAMTVTTRGGRHIIEAEVDLAGLEPASLRVELFADGLAAGPPLLREMKLVGEGIGTAGRSLYRADVPADRPAADLTVRVRPFREGVAVPLEESRILWQR